RALPAGRLLEPRHSSRNHHTVRYICQDMPTKRSSPSPPAPQRPTGRLILSGLTAFGYHGNKPAERKLGQTFTVDLEVTIDTHKAADTDRIEDTISYPLLEKTARLILEGKPANLLETVAERIATAILKHRGVT